MKNNEPASNMSRAVHLWPVAILIAGMGACAAGATVSPLYWNFFGLLFMLSLASLLGGALFGFLFGIPRLNRSYDPREDYGRTTKYMPNTNLEEVSDWLTKIIIGVTLTQLTKIPGYLQGMADYIVANIQCGTPDCNLARPVIIALFIYFLIALLCEKFPDATPAMIGQELIRTAGRLSSPAMDVGAGIPLAP